MAPPATLEEPQPLTAEDEGVYQAVIRIAPPGAIQRCDPELVIKCIRGYKKEKPRVEQTVAELLRIHDWREKDEIDLLLTKHLPKEAEFSRGWPTCIYGEDDTGHVVFMERIEDIDTEFLAKSLTLDKMLDLRAQVFEALNLEKDFISRRRGYLVYKHISVVDLKNLKMSHFSKEVRSVIKAIIGLGSDFYPESLWKLYLINAPMIFRTVWAVIKPMVHPETLAKTFILGGEKDFLPVLTREGLPLSSVPACSGGKHTGTTSTVLCSTAIAFCSAAARRYPNVAPCDRVRVAMANLKPETMTMADAAAELTAAAELGPAVDFIVPPKRALPPPEAPPPQAQPQTSSRRGSFDIHLPDLRRSSTKGAGSGQNSPQRMAHSNAPQPPHLGVAASRAAAARDGQGSPGRVSRANSFEGEPKGKSPPSSPRLGTRSGGAPGSPDLGRMSGLESHQPEGHPTQPRRRRRGFFACCGCGGADEDDDGGRAQAPPGGDARAGGSRTLPRLSEVSAHAERNSSFAARSTIDDDDDDDDFFDPRDEFSVYAPSDNED